MAIAHFKQQLLRRKAGSRRNQTQASRQPTNHLGSVITI
jgi:hypothetical protein